MSQASEHICCREFLREALAENHFLVQPILALSPFSFYYLYSCFF